MIKIAMIILSLLIITLIIIAPNHLQDQTFVLSNAKESAMTTKERHLILILAGLIVVLIFLIKQC